MASIRERALAGGLRSFTVNWRDPETGFDSRTYSEKDFIKKGRPAYEAEEKAIELKAFLDGNGNSFKLAAEAKIRKDSTAPTVAEVVEDHIRLLRKPQPGTIDKYWRNYHNHIENSPLGKTTVDRVTEEKVIAWHDSLVIVEGSRGVVGSPLAPKTKKNIQGLLSDAFKRAVKAGRMDHNPAVGVAEAVTDEEDAALVYLSEADLELIASEASEEYQTFLRMLNLTGLRYSEATALRKRDILIRDGRAFVKVTRAWKEPRGGKPPFIGPPKSKKSKRTIPCNKRLSALLVEYMKDRELDDLLFTQPNGEPLHNSRFHKLEWQGLMTRLIEEGKLEEKPRIHDIRAAHTTHLLERGVPVHEVQDRLGHEDPKTTLKIYARLGKNSSVTAADALD